MSSSALRERLTSASLAFAWEQWAQLGVLAETSRRDRWAADPEALLLFSLDVGRDDPRLFDELLDWFRLNERIVSVQRLKNLAVTDTHRALIGAARDWVASGKRKRDDGVIAPTPEAQLLFRDSTVAPARSDPAFLRHGFLRGELAPSRKSSAPDLHAPIAFAFRLRHLLGLGARAEVVRFLLTVDGFDVTTAVITRAVAYARRNVLDALAALSAAGGISYVSVGNEQRYSIDRDRWAALLDMEQASLPVHRDWPQLLRAAAALLAWLADPRLDDLSEYMRSSEARLALERIEPDLRYAGVRIEAPERIEDDWGRVEAAVTALAALFEDPRGPGSP
ncbi:MAG: hypothetical protein ACRDJY_01030 [Thermoleophilaceae bacterium]